MLEPLSPASLSLKARAQDPILDPRAHRKAVLMGYLKEFHPSPWIKPFNPKTIRRMQVLVERMGLVLDGLNSGEVPGCKLTKKGLERLCRSLVEGQRRTPSGLEGLWAVLPEKFGSEVPSDVQVHFVFMPTYLAISILTKVVAGFPNIAERIPGYLETLKRGYRFASLRGLRGHGYTATGTMMQTVELFREGGVLKFLSHNPEFSPKLYRVLQEIRSEAESKLEKGDTEGAWGEDYTERLRRVVKSLENF